jgi:hypothetical protein
MMDLDYAIVGGGLAGLYAAREIAKKHPKATIAVFEKYRVFGGRVLTFREGPYQWEAGAGRIHSSHKLVRGLLKQYGLKEVPISSEVGWVNTYGSPLVPNHWEESLPSWLSEISRLSSKQLAEHTVFELLTQIFGEKMATQMVAPFPYYGEIYTLRADVAIQSFQREMGTHQHFSVSPDGYDTLIGTLAEDCYNHGVTLETHWDLTAATPEGSAIRLWFALGSPKEKEGRQIREVLAKQVIFALHRDALAKINLFKGLPLLSKVKMDPLHRIYAVFPKSHDGTTWFQDIGRFVTGTPIRYFIPINPEKGITMISYTDGKDTEVWTDLAYGAEPKNETLGFLLTEECRRLFPKKDIPFPIFLKSHPWDSGCSYWVPGDYSVEKASKESLQPFGQTLPNVYVCGESFSLRQAWMEGALENTRDLLRIL